MEARRRLRSDIYIYICIYTELSSPFFQAVALQSHLVKVSNNSPVEVGLDMKRVEVSKEAIRSALQR